MYLSVERSATDQTDSVVYLIEFRMESVRNHSFNGVRENLIQVCGLRTVRTIRII